MKEVKDIGQLDRRVSIEYYSETKNAFGEAEKAWQSIATVWAKVDYLNKLDNQEKFEVGRETAIDKVKFTIRYRSGVDARMRILYQSVYYNIRAISEVGRRDYMELMTDGRDH